MAKATDGAKNLKQRPRTLRRKEVWNDRRVWQGTGEALGKGLERPRESEGAIVPE
jgi:hypothetical protein